MASPDPSDRAAYLEEQLQRQKHGEPIDVAWVRAELERVRQEQIARLATSQRNLRWLVVGTSLLLLVLWLRNGGAGRIAGVPTIAVVLIGLLAAWAIGYRRR